MSAVADYLEEQAGALLEQACVPRAVYLPGNSPDAYGAQTVSYTHLDVYKRQPQFFLPVHGEYKHLKKHAQTAAAVGIPEKNIYIGENGDCVVLSADGLTGGEPLPAGAVMVDGLGVGDVGNVVLRDRRHLSEDGLVIRCV